MTHKVYYTYPEIHEQVHALAKEITREYDPELIIAIGGGGLVPGRILRTYIDVPLLVVTLESYSGEQQTELKKRQWIDPDTIAGKRVLVIDELDDTGRTLAYCVNELKKEKPAEIAAAVLHYKIKEKIEQLDEVKYYVGKPVPDQWIVYPWERTTFDDDVSSC